MKHRFAAPALWGLAAAVAIGIGLAVRSANTLEFYSASWFDVFDTVTTVTGYAHNKAEWDRQMEALHADLLDAHRRYDIYNTYEGMTNLASVNAQAGQSPVAVDAETFAFLCFAREMAATTEGACNLAAGAVLGLWHDARYAESPAPPQQAALDAAMQHCDLNDLLLTPTEQGGTVAFADPELQLDVGSLAKGYAVEQAAQAAEARGLTSALLDVGGNLRAIGSKPGGKHWTAGVRNPWGSDPAMVWALELQPGQSLVISGDDQRFFEYEGVRYHHLIDLSTGQPARTANSVAVLCSDGGLADGLSTGLFCLPPAQGMALAESLDGVQALWMLPDGSMPATSGWPEDLLAE